MTSSVRRETLDLDAYDRLSRSDCFVCRLAQGRPMMDGHRTVYEDAAVIAFLTPIPPQRGYALVCPKRHVVRFESDLDAEEWRHVQAVVQAVAGAIARATDAMRMYTAILGSPERNPHVHVHVCPCPPGTPFAGQHWDTLKPPDGTYVWLSDEERDELAAAIRRELGGWAYAP